MPSRLELGYRTRYRLLLRRAGREPTEALVGDLVERARRQRATEGLPLPLALERVLHQAHDELGIRAAAEGAPDDLELLCDGALAGLARWLWAAGLLARAFPGTPAAALLGRARRPGRVLLTTDSRLMERRLVRSGVVRALWIPSSLGRAEQLGAVLMDLGYRPGAPRCMACGGRLRTVPKQEVRDRIPPRTAGWKDDYFVCTGCGQLFWEGTHWQRIRARIAALAT